MAWGAPKPGVTIPYIESIVKRIGKYDLKNGDALYCPTKHIALFLQWGYDDHSEYIGIELSNSTGLGTIKRYIPYPYFNGDTCFYPIQYSDIC